MAVDGNAKIALVALPRPVHRIWTNTDPNQGMDAVRKLDEDVRVHGASFGQLLGHGFYPPDTAGTTRRCTRSIRSASSSTSRSSSTRACPVRGLRFAPQEVGAARRSVLVLPGMLAHFPGEAATGLQRSKDSPGCLLLLQHPMQGGVGKSCVESAKNCMSSAASWTASMPFARAAAIISGELSTPSTIAPRSMIFLVSVPSPQPTSRMRSPGCGSSKSRAAPPSSATKAPTRA